MMLMEAQSAISSSFVFRGLTSRVTLPPRPNCQDLRRRSSVGEELLQFLTYRDYRHVRSSRRPTYDKANCLH